MGKLEGAGLLRAPYTHPIGRSGPGAGRTAKLYSLTERELSVSASPRHYGLLASLLVSSMERDPTGASQRAVSPTENDASQHLGADSCGNPLAALTGCGYQPQGCKEGRVELGTCPLHGLSEEHHEIVFGRNVPPIGRNVHLIERILDSSDPNGARADLGFTMTILLRPERASRNRMDEWT